MKFNKLNEAFALREMERNASLQNLSEGEVFELEQSVIFGEGSNDVDVVETLNEALEDEDEEVDSLQETNRFKTCPRCKNKLGIKKTKCYKCDTSLKDLEVEPANFEEDSSVVTEGFVKKGINKLAKLSVGLLSAKQLDNFISKVISKLVPKDKQKYSKKLEGLNKKQQKEFIRQLMDASYEKNNKVLDELESKLAKAKFDENSINESVVLTGAIAASLGTALWATLVSLVSAWDAVLFGALTGTILTASLKDRV